jgi:nicotinamidase-related amidase
MSAMNKNVLIVVDMQNDFISGALGSKEAETIVERVAEKVKAAGE